MIRNDGEGRWPKPVPRHNRTSHVVRNPPENLTPSAKMTANRKLDARQHRFILAYEPRRTRSPSRLVVAIKCARRTTLAREIAADAARPSVSQNTDVARFALPHGHAAPPTGDSSLRGRLPGAALTTSPELSGENPLLLRT